MTSFNPSRRNFLKTSAIGTGGLVVGFTLSPLSMAIAGESGEGFKPNAIIEISADNRIIFTSPRDEMGQGATTGLGTIFAEELDVDPQRLEIRLPGVDREYDNPDFNMQVTGGSTAVKAHYLPLRQAGANIRQVILEAASRELNVPVDQLTTEDAHVIANGERYPYGRFAGAAGKLKMPKKAPMKSRSEFRYIGKEFPRLDGMGKSTGTAEFGLDVDLPGMHRAVVIRAPVAGSSLKSFNADTARAMPGVTEVLEISNGVAVVAEQYWQAKKAASTVETEWESTELTGVNTQQIREDFANDMIEGDSVSTGKRGSLRKGFASATNTVDNEYWTPYLSHSPMEPMNAVVRTDGKSAEVWTGSQAPAVARGMAARALDIDEDAITVHSTYMGGGFGRRATLGHVREAAEIAGATNKPIQVIWSREDDIRHGVFRPASLMRIEAGIDDEGLITAWHGTRVGGNNMTTTIEMQMPALFPNMPQGLINFAVGATDKVMSDWTVDSGSIEGLYEDYDFPNRKATHITREHGVPLTFWRAVGHSFTSFAKETTIDELAEKSKLDPVEFRLRNLKENPRLAGTLLAVADAVNSSNTERAVGYASHASFASYVSQAAEVSVENGRIRVHKVICAIDCGQVVNPDVVRAQVEGAVMFGLTAALHGKHELVDGAIAESNFHDYPILRMNEAPEVEVIILDSDEPPTGVGEPGLPPIAPAVANAVYTATGQRLRELPLKPA